MHSSVGQLVVLGLLAVLLRCCFSLARQPRSCLSVMPAPDEGARGSVRGGVYSVRAIDVGGFMYEAQFQLLSCTGKGTSKGTVYEIAGSDGIKYTTWDANIAAKASGLQGQVVAARVEQKQNGKFTNYVLHDVGLPGSLAPVGAPVAVIPPAAPSAVAAI